ncbi:MAG: hypothetical protein O7E49_07445, partial [Gemmatimonadetes bacterium]|nr:hypothetical protein [Gemmatimonadota bacterium]
MSDVRQYLSHWVVTPAFSDLFGRSPTMDELLGIIRRYPVAEWLSYLSRIQNLLGGDRVGNS